MLSSKIAHEEGQAGGRMIETIECNRCGKIATSCLMDASCEEQLTLTKMLLQHLRYCILKVPEAVSILDYCKQLKDRLDKPTSTS